MFKGSIKKLQALPEKHKIAIIVAVVALAAIIMGYFWVMDVKNTIPKIQDSLTSAPLPKIDLPQIQTPAPSAPPDDAVK